MLGSAVQLGVAYDEWVGSRVDADLEWMRIPLRRSLPVDPCQWIPASGSLPVDPCQWIPASGSLPVDPCQWIPASGSLPVDPCQWILPDGSLPVAKDHCPRWCLLIPHDTFWIRFDPGGLVSRMGPHINPPGRITRHAPGSAAGLWGLGWRRCGGCTCTCCSCTCCSCTWAYAPPLNDHP